MTSPEEQPLSREVLLCDTFVALADTLVADFDVIELLTVLSRRCLRLMRATESGVLVVDATGALSVMAASSELSHILELFQVQNEEGPCLEAFRSGELVVEDDLTKSTRWPRFTQMALDAGLPSVHAFPMRVRSQILGTLSLFGSAPGLLSEADVIIAQALAHVATIALLQSRAVHDASELAVQLQGALLSRVVIEQAKGVMAATSGVTTEEAFRSLRGYARDHNLKLTNLARDVVERRLSDVEFTTLLRPRLPPNR